MPEPIRHELVNEIKSKIEQGTYYTNEKWCRALVRLRLALKRELDE